MLRLCLRSLTLFNLGKRKPTSCSFVKSSSRESQTVLHDAQANSFLRFGQNGETIIFETIDPQPTNYGGLEEEDPPWSELMVPTLVIVETLIHYFCLD